MEYKYMVMVNTYHEEQGDRIGYGIAVIEKESDEDMTIVATAYDLSPNCDKVRHLTNLCNQLQLVPDHFFDVVEDYEFC